MDKESLDEEGLADFEVRAGYGLQWGWVMCGAGCIMPGEMGLPGGGSGAGSGYVD